MSKPYSALNNTWGTLASEYVHGTDNHLHLVAIGLFPSGGGYIRVKTTDALHVARLEYTGVSTNDLTGLSQANISGEKHTDAAYTFPAGAIVELADMAEYVNDKVDKNVLTANSLLKADSAATPAVLEVAASRIVARLAAGGIVAATTAELKTLCAYLTDLVDDTTPQLGGDLDFNGKCAEFDDTLGSNSTYSGLTVKAAVGESVAFPDLLYFDLSEGEWKKASPATIGTMPVQGMALESKGDGEVCKILMMGFVRYDTWTWTVDDTKKVLYASTSGAMSETAVSTSGYYSQAVAMIRSATTIFFNPSLAMAKKT